MKPQDRNRRSIWPCGRWNSTPLPRSSRHKPNCGRSRAVDAGPWAGAHSANSGQVERVVTAGDVLGVAEHEGEVDAELCLHRTGSGQLLARQVDPDRARSRPRQPRRDIGGAAAQLDCVHPGHVRGKHLDLRLRGRPQPPARRRRRPLTARERTVCRGRLLIPVAGFSSTSSVWSS